MYAIPSLVSFIILVGMVIYILGIRGDRRRFPLAFASLSLAIYSIGEFIERSCRYSFTPPYPDYQIWLVSSKIMGLGILFSLIEFVIFLIYFPYTIKGRWIFKPRTVEVIVYLLSLIFTYLILFTELIIRNTPMTYPSGDIGYGQRNGLLMPFVGIIILMVFGLVFYRLVRVYISGDKWVKQQIMLLGWGFGIFAIATIITGAIPWILNMDVYPITTTLTIFPVAFVAYAIKKYKLFHFQSREEKKEKVERYVTLEKGKNYLFLENRPYLSLNSFRKFVEGSKGLIVTSHPPPIIKENFRFEKTPFLWVSEEQYDTFSCSPYRIDFEIANSIIEFMREGKNGVYLDSLEYLNMIHNEEKVLEFAKLMVDSSVSNDSTLIISTNPNGWDERNIEILKGLFDEVIEFSTTEGFKKPSSILFLGDRNRFVEMEKCDLIVSIINPKKLKDKNKEIKKGYWLTNIESDIGIKPDRIEFELLDRLYGELKKGEKGILCLCDLEYLIKFNKISKIVEILKNIRDAYILKGWKMKAQINPNVVEREKIKLLSSLFDSEKYIMS